MSASDNILKAIEYAISRQTINTDKTFRSVIKGITSNGYVVRDMSGADRTVKSSIPGLDLKVGTNVWVKIPCGKLNQIHICGVV